MMSRIASSLERSFHVYSGEGFTIDDELFFSETEIILTHYDGVLALIGTPCQYYLETRSEFYSTLVASQDARDVVDTIRRAYFSDRIMIGVHFRTHDSQTDWEVVPPHDGSSTATRFGEGATVDDFVGIMTMIESKFSTMDERGDYRRRHRFFIASNNVEVKKNFLTRFPDSVTLSAADFSRTSSEGMFSALVDWMLLSRSSIIINTYGSSFAAEAAAVKQLILVSIWGGHYIHHSDVRLPFCGHPQFARAYSRQAAASMNYTEGTTGRRTLYGKTVTLKTSQHLMGWGIPEVYCLTDDNDVN